MVFTFILVFVVLLSLVGGVVCIVSMYKDKKFDWTILMLLVYCILVIVFMIWTELAI